jgi:hypothetical protein
MRPSVLQQGELVAGPYSPWRQLTRRGHGGEPSEERVDSKAHDMTRDAALRCIPEDSVATPHEEGRRLDGCCAGM